MTGIERFSTILALCLEEIEAGRADAVTCAARYPEYPQLAGILTLAADLWALPLPEPEPGRAAAAELRVRQAITRHGDLYLVEHGAGHGPDVLAGALEAAHDAGLQRRRHPRVPVLLDGTLWVVARDGVRQRSIPITVVDVSAGGLGFRASECLEPGASVEIELALADDGRRAASGPGSIVTVLARQWPREGTPAAGRRRSRRAVLGRLAALARVVHCGLPGEATGDPGLTVSFRGGAEIVALSARARRRGA